MAPVIGAAARALPLASRLLPILGAAGGNSDNPIETARRLLQFGVALLGTSWVIFGFYGWRLSKAGEPEANRVYDTSTQGWGLGATTGGAPGGGGSPNSSGSGMDIANRAAQAEGVPDWPTKLGFWEILFEESSSTPSSLNCTADNPTSTAYGIWQGITETSSDCYTQMVHYIQYLKSRYGSPEQAWAFWQRNGWY